LGYYNLTHWLDETSHLCRHHDLLLPRVRIFLRNQCNADSSDGLSCKNIFKKLLLHTAQSIQHKSWSYFLVVGTCKVWHNFDGEIDWHQRMTIADLHFAPLVWRNWPLMSELLKNQNLFLIQMFGPGFSLTLLMNTIKDVKPRSVLLGTHHYVQLSESALLQQTDTKDLVSISPTYK
jgi:hypothetical protein